MASIVRRPPWVGDVEGKTAENECGHAVIATWLTVVDDTARPSKAILGALTVQLGALSVILTHRLSAHQPTTLTVDSHQLSVLHISDLAARLPSPFLPAPHILT